MKIYRIEKPSTGNGPFMSGVALDHHYDPPGPIEDKVFGDLYDYLDLIRSGEMDRFKFGFQSKEHLLHWFKKSDLKYFERCGLKLREYEIPEWKVYRGGKQCAFDPDDAYKYRNVKAKVLH